MKGTNFRVVLDACLMANYGVCDLFLRLAERPRLYSPKWSDKVLQETGRVHQKLNWPAHLCTSWHREVATHFPEALVEDASCLEPVLVNDAKDRHVLATAIRAGCTTVVTFNLRDFLPESLSPWDIHAVHPADYLITLYSISPDVVIAKLGDMAGARKISAEAGLSKLSKSVPSFAAHVAQSVGWSIGV